MVTTVLCLLALAQAPNAEPVKVAVPGLKLNGLDEKLADFYSGHLAQQLSFQGINTITSAEMAALLGLERQRQLLGCNSDTCKADIATTLGVDGILVGSVTKLEKSFLLDVRIISAGTGAPLAAASSNSDDNDRLVGTFTVVAAELARQVGQKLNRTVAAKPGMELVQGPSRAKRLSWLPLAVGVAAGVVGGVFLGLSRGTYSQFSTLPSDGKPRDMAATEALASSGSMQQTIGWVGVGVAGAGVLTAALLFLLGGNETVTGGLAVTPGSVTIGLSGVWP